MGGGRHMLSHVHNPMLLLCSKVTQTRSASTTTITDRTTSSASSPSRLTSPPDSLREPLGSVVQTLVGAPHPTTGSTGFPTAGEARRLRGECSTPTSCPTPAGPTSLTLASASLGCFQALPIAKVGMGGWGGVCLWVMYCIHIA